MQRYVKVATEDELLIVTLDRADKHNAFHPDSHAQLDAIWNEFETDPRRRVAILTGAGDRAFSVGSDLTGYDAASAGAAAKLELPASGYAGLTKRLNRRKPIIAAVNGLALGGGFEVMLCCDLAVCAANAQFGLPEPLVGAAALAGGIPRLCEKLPFTIAMTLLLTGDRLAAADALHHGLVTEVVPQGEVLAAARSVAQRVLRAAPLAVAATKAVADRCLQGASLQEVLEFEDGEPARTVMASEDLREGVAAFFAKRAAQWRGR